MVQQAVQQIHSKLKRLQQSHIPQQLNYRRAACHPNRLRSPFCTKTRSNTAHQQVHNKSYKWSVGFNVNGLAVRPTYRMTYIHHIACTDGAHVCQVAYTISKYVRRNSLASLTGTARRESRFGASPHPASPSLVLDGQT